MWLRKKVPGDFLSRPLHCGLLSSKKTTEVLSRNPTVAFNADALEQNGRRDNIQILGVVAEHNEDKYQKVVDVAKKIGVTIDKTDINVCHCLPARRNGPKGIVVKCFKRHTNHLIIGNKKNLRKMGQRLFINDDLTPLRGKVMYLIRKKRGSFECDYCK